MAEPDRNSKSQSLVEDRYQKSATHWWWAGGSAAQFGWAVRSYRRGCTGSSGLMPLKAFAVASLFVSSLAFASVAFLRANGIHKVEDAMEVGASIRAGLGIPSRTRKE